VNGGPAAVILALEEVLGPHGTLVMPTHTGHLTDPAQWQHPPIPEAWWEMVRQTMPAFDLDLTPTREMGAIPETFRKQKGVLRSFHPHVSFAAWGAHAAVVTASHALHDGLGEESPLARIYDLDGLILLLGAGHANNTSLHLAEYRAEFAGKRRIIQGAPLVVDGEARWVQVSDIDWNADDFEAIGETFRQETALVQKAKVGQADTLLMPQRALVDYAVRWMEANRGVPAGGL
jgi:aminoglycoside 3-N-acetyltransferase